MNSRLTLGLAGVFMVGAIVAGYKGLMVGRDTSNPPLPLTSTDEVETEVVSEALSLGREQLELVQDTLDKEQRSAVVVLKRDLPALTEITTDDLEIEFLRIAPPETFSGFEKLLGLRTWQDLPAGLVLTTHHLQTGGPIAHMIRPEERALAISIDEVTSAGGHLRPGDFVDLLLYLRRDDINNDQTAQLVLPAIRVLSVGDQLGSTLTGEPAQYPLKDGDTDRRRSNQAKTAVIAVHEKLVTRLWLATQIQGSNLRLAVRSQDEELLSKYYAGESLTERIDEAERQLFQFEQLALRQATAISHVIPVQSARATSGVPTKPKVEVYRGSQVSSHTP